MGQIIERIILAAPRSDISQAQADVAIEAGRELISAIPDIELVSFGMQQWMPIIKEQITTDYRIQYDTSIE
jgi:hypothetical protein